MAERLSPREAKRLAYAEAAELIRTRLEDAPAEALADALLIGATDDTPSLDDLDVDQATRALAAALDEVMGGLLGRAEKFLQEVKPRTPRTPEVDEMLVRLWARYGVSQEAEETALLSLARPSGHGRHRFTWVSPDGVRETVEAGTAVLAVGKALRVEEGRLRSRLGEALRDERERLGLTQRAAAVRLGVTRLKLSEMERGRTEIPVDALDRLHEDEAA